MNQLISLATPVLSAVLLSILAVAVPLAYRKGLAVLEARKIDTTVYEAIGRAGGAAYLAFVASGRPVTDKAALEAAAAVGGRYLQARAADAIATKAGAAVSPGALADMAGAELGKLLAADPSVKVPTN